MGVNPHPTQLAHITWPTVEYAGSPLDTEVTRVGNQHVLGQLRVAGGGDVASQPGFYMQHTSNLLAGRVNLAEIALTLGTACLVNHAEAFRVSIAAEVSTGDWVNAIVGQINYGAAGDANGGMAAAICAEIVMPNKTLGGGEYNALDCEIGGGASTVFSGRKVSFAKFGCWSAETVVQMDLSGYLFYIQGFAEGSNKLIDNDGGAPAATGGIRIRCDAKDLWLLYRDTAPA